MKEQIERLWSAKLGFDNELLDFNVFSSGLFLSEASTVDDSGFVLAKGPAQYEDPGRAHISAAWSSDPVSFQLLVARCRDSLARLGYKSVRFGEDWRHFFPGLPADRELQRTALEAIGLAPMGPPVFDVERDLASYEPPCPTSSAVRKCSLQDRVRLSTFMGAEFAGRWALDVMEKFDEEPHRIYVLEIDGEFNGFAMTQMDGDTHRRAGAVWSHTLGPRWGALGPIGVAKSSRGRGLGHGLLASCLCDLRDQGARQTVIDWTVLTKFYGAHGFIPTREYQPMAGPLA